MRPTLLSAVLLTFLPSLLTAQDEKKPSTTDVPPHKMLHTFLLNEAQKHFDARRDVIAKLKTPEQIKARQTELKKKFLAALGDLPAKTPLNAKVVGTIKADGYRIEKIIFESRTEHHVTAALYIPDGKGPFPGVLVPCGHSTNGKAAEAYQRASILMAKNGMVALCYDPIGQGERLQLLAKTGKGAIPGSTSEHTMVGVGALLVGRSTATYRIWDGMRAMDYLESRPEVNAKKLGCAGNSGGGTMTAYLMALDPRIVCATPSCYITSLERLFATIGPQDAEQNITGQVAFGMEHADYLTMRAPLPTLMAVGTQDFFDIKGAWNSYHEASEIYKKMDAGDRMSIFEFDDKHGWWKPRREACVGWLRRWLVGVNEKVIETDFPIFKDADLQCTRSGQVLEDFRGVSVFDLNRQRDEELAKDRANFPKMPTTEQRDLVWGLLYPFTSTRVIGGLGIRLDPPGRRLVENDLSIEFIVRKGDETKTGKTAIYLDDRGFAAEAGKGGRLDQLAKQYDRVIAVDLRGIGDTAPGKLKPGRAAYFGVDSKEAFLGIHLNRPLLGQRVSDLLFHFLPVSVEGIKLPTVHIIARGPIVGLAALHGAALNPNVTSVTIEDGLLSWSNVVQTPVSYNQLTNVVPGVLKHYDLPELATMIAPRPLTIRNPIDAAGRPVSQKAVEETYRPTTAHYARDKTTSKNLILQGK